MPENLYPQITSKLIQNPNRWYAFPFFGGFIKLIMLIPIGFELFGVSIAAWVVTLINSFIVLFTGKYWKVAYEINTGLIRLGIKTSYFFSGLTDTYPGFSLDSKEISIDIPYPDNPNRLFAIPIFGGIARFILLIPYIIYSSFISQAAGIGVVLSSIPVLLMGQYPESTFQLKRDSVRISQSMQMYTAGLSDRYPSWWISMEHKMAKLILIGIAIFITLMRFLVPLTVPHPKPSPAPYHYSYPSAQKYPSTY